MHTFSEFQQLHEIMQQPQPWQWTEQEPGMMYSATFDTSEDRTFLVSIFVEDPEEQSWDVEFVDENFQNRKTGAGQQFEVFATVFDIIKAFIELEEGNIGKIVMPARKEEESRVRLYDKLARKYKPRGWRLNVETGSKMINFILSPN